MNKTRKEFCSVSTHVTKDELATLKSIFAEEGTTIYAFLKACLDAKLSQHLPELPVEDDSLLGE